MECLIFPVGTYSHEFGLLGNLNVRRSMLQKCFAGITTKYLIDQLPYQHLHTERTKNQVLHLVFRTHYANGLET